MKYEEIYPPQLLEWIDFKYKHEIIKYEAEVLKTLDFQLVHYSQEHFLSIYIWEEKINQRNDLDLSENNCLCQMVLDLLLFDINMGQFKPSLLAKCILLMCRGREKEIADDKILLNIKWMVERNK